MASSEHSIPFYVVREGEVEHVRDIPESAVLSCPFLIIAPQHYRADNTCRCDDPEHSEMKEWGYHWSMKEARWM